MRRVCVLFGLLTLAAALAPASSGAGDHGPGRIVGITLPPVPATGPGGESPTPAGPCLSRPSEADAADVTSAARWQIVYFVPAGSCDEGLDVRAAGASASTLERSINSINAWFVAQGFKAMRIDRVAGGAMDIPFVRGSSGPSSYRDLEPIMNELRSRGFNKSGKRYIVFAAADAEDVCGEAEWPGEYAAVFLNSVSGCGTRGFGDGTVAGSSTSEVVTAHEVLHTEGVVYLESTHHCWTALGHVCTLGASAALTALGMDRTDPESRDVMYAYILGHRLADKKLDVGHDDYFRHPFIAGLEASMYFG